VKRQVRYRWRLREVMAAQGMFTTTELVPPLRERGIDLSASQVHRLVTGTPERLSLPVLAALCDIFEATPAELIVTAADNVGVQNRHRRRTGDPDRGEAAADPGPHPTRRMSRGLSNNGTVSGVSGWKIAGLPPLTVRMWVEWFRSGASRCSGEAR